jgi:uncharacterized protein YndB with AHSA1/START domain
MAPRKLSVDQAYFYRTTPERLFRAISDPRWLDRWFLEKAELTPRAGTRYRFEWPGGYAHRGRVLEFVPGRRLVLSWPNGPVSDRFTTRVTLSVRRAGAGTFLKVHHAGFPATPVGIAQYGGTQSGWGYYLLNLRSVLEHEVDLRSPRDA